MLLEFGCRNFFSFREGLTVSFRLDANCPSDISNGLQYAPVICVKGANASGKTQVLKAISFLSNFCTKSFDSDVDDAISVSPFFDSEEPCEFFADFNYHGTEYRYELIATDQEVKSEILYKKKQRQSKVFERIGNEFTYTPKSVAPLKSMTLRKNASVISTAHQYDLKIKEVRDVYFFFKLIFSNVNFTGLRERPRDIFWVTDYLKKNPKIFDFVKEFIKECDTGISDIQIFEVTDNDNKKKFAPAFLHRHGDEDHVVVSMTESSGTKTLYRDLTSYHLALEYGGMVVADELDINLHPFLLRKIVELFLNEETNPHGAQLIFSTHNSEIMDQLGRYRVYMVNKDNNESFAYRLDDFPGDVVRNGRAISPAYKDGKIGGVPRL